MGDLLVILRHDLEGLGSKGEGVSQEKLDAYVRKLNSEVEQMLSVLAPKDAASAEGGEDR